MNHSKGQNDSGPFERSKKKQAAPSRTGLYRIGDIQPNPFRDFSACPLDDRKIETLRESLLATGWWENVVARLTSDGIPQLAYGHHRLEALRRTLGEGTKVRLIIRDLDGAMMLRMMVRENMEHWAPNMRTHMASVRAAVEAYAAGTIDLPLPAPKTPKATLRHAPSFIPGHLPGGSREDRPYSVLSLGGFLGWDRTKIEDTLAGLALIEHGLDSRVYDGLSLNEARFVTRQVHKAAVSDAAWLTAYDDTAARCRAEAERAPESEKARLADEAARIEALAGRLRGDFSERATFVAERALDALGLRNFHGVKEYRAEPEMDRLLRAELPKVSDARIWHERVIDKYLAEIAHNFCGELDEMLRVADQFSEEQWLNSRRRAHDVHEALEALDAALRTRFASAARRMVDDGSVLPDNALVAAAPELAILPSMVPSPA